jgi:hypothetical protein
MLTSFCQNWVKPLLHAICHEGDATFFKLTVLHIGEMSCFNKAYVVGLHGPAEDLD